MPDLPSGRSVPVSFIDRQTKRGPACDASPTPSVSHAVRGRFTYTIRRNATDYGGAQILGSGYHPHSLDAHIWATALKLTVQALLLEEPRCLEGVPLLQTGLA
jgi:hypothetical protein